MSKICTITAYLANIKDMLNQYTIHFKAIFNMGIALALIFIIRYFFNYLTKIMTQKKGEWIKPVIFKKNEIISAEIVLMVINNGINILKYFVILFILYLMIPFVLQELPATHDYARALTKSIENDLLKIGSNVLAFIPNIFFIGCTVFFARVLIRFLKFIFIKIERSEIQIDNFYPEWANTTFQLIRFFILAFSLVIVYPYLPGSGTKALEGVSVFLGLMLSIGSSSTIGNLIAGVMISYMRAFKIGDYVKIGESLGQVVEKGIIVTKIMTYKNEEITIPNTKILSTEVINYTTRATAKELILYTSVTIGYDTPWPLVHSMLKEAANRSTLIDKKLAPFILQTALNDYHVSYQLNVYTENVGKIPMTYSELHQNIQQVFSENKIEIMSPAFTVLRNTPKNTTPSL